MPPGGLAAPAAGSTAEEHVVVVPGERRKAVVTVIRSAQQRLILSLFRCTDFKVLAELAEARKRQVRVQVLITHRAKGWKKRLEGLCSLLTAMGAEVRRYSGACSKYHAKYMVADEGPALITSLNFTLKCFKHTCDFLLLTHDPEVVCALKQLFEADWHAPESSFPEGLSERLVIGPERARAQISALLQQAVHSIRIIDHRVVDPAMVELLKAKQAEGVAVEVLGRGELGGLLSHGKMILVDESTALIGSMSLSGPNLDHRREVAALIREAHGVAKLVEFFQSLAAAPVPQAVPSAAAVASPTPPAGAANTLGPVEVRMANGSVSADPKDQDEESGPEGLD